MELLIRKRYLKIPVRFGGETAKFALYADDALVYGFDAAYTEEEPDAIYDVDLRDYVGKPLQLTASVPFVPQFSNWPEAAEQNKLRPAVHFTAPLGWINDPNGLCCYNGEYHLFYQHNPLDRVWGNMHWGHAVSRDLLHWTHCEEALFPDASGTMFSGSAVVDKQNISGMQTGEDAPILFYYTCAGEKESTQCLAVSRDGGKTLEKYGGNPLLASLADGNRDPKIIYDAARSRWLMSLYLIERTFAIFTSQNLVDWTEIQRFDLPGDDECPDLYPLTADDGRTLWVFSGAHDCYFVGEFDENGLYQPIQSAGQLSYASEAYAAQTYFYEPGKPVVRFAWNRSDIPGAAFNGSMCTPTEMGLRRIGERYYLTAVPAAQTERLERSVYKAADVRRYTVEATEPAFRVDITAAEPFTCTLFGLDITASADGVRCKDVFLPRVGDGEMRLTVIWDTISTELYLNGSAISAIAHIADRTKRTLTVESGAPFSVRACDLAL